MLGDWNTSGSAKGKCIIENPVKIAGMVEKFRAPVRADKCPPVIPDSDKMLRDICYNKAHPMYGEDLPEIVTERLEKSASRN